MATGGRLRGPGAARSSDDGQSLIEFTLGLLVLALLIFGIVDFGRAVFARNAVASAAREGARYAALHPEASESDVAAHAKALLGAIDTDAVDVDVSVNSTTGEVLVEVTYAYHAITPLIGQLVEGPGGTGLVLKGRSKMKIERGN